MGGYIDPSLQACSNPPGSSPLFPKKLLHKAEMIKRRAVVDAAFIPVTLGILVMVFMTPFILPPTGNEVLDGHDLLNQQYPLYSFIFDSLRGGNGLPLWNPYLFAGQSVVGNPQSTIFYPPAWIMAAIGVPRGVGWLVVLHLWLGAWGMATFARGLGASRLGRLAGGVIYAFSGVMSAHLNAGHLNYLMCAAWLPWMAAGYLWGVGRSEADKARLVPTQLLLRLLPGAAAVGMCILTGHPPMLYFGAVWLVVMGVYAVKTGRATWLQAVRSLAVMLAGGVILGAALLLPVGEFTLRSTRSEAGLWFSNSFAMPPIQLWSLLVPNLFGEPRGGYWGVPFYEELTAYVGILPLIAVFVVRRRAETVLLAGFMVVGIVVSLGVEGGLFTLLYYLLPGYSLFRVPSRALYFFMVGGAGLAALLITDLQNNTFRLSRRVLILPLIGTLCLIVAVVVFSQPDWTTEAVTLSRQGSVIKNMTIHAGLVILWTFVGLGLWKVIRTRWAMAFTFLVLLVDLWRVFAPLVTVSTVDVPDMWKAMSRVVSASPDYRVMTVPNQLVWQAGAVYSHHLNASGYDPLVSEAYQQLLDASGYNPTSPIARLLGVRYLISDRAYEYSGLPGLEALISKTEEGKWTIYEIADSVPRAFIVPTLRVVADDEAARQIMRSADFDALLAPQSLILDKPLPTSCDFDKALNPEHPFYYGEGYAAAQIVAYTPNQVRIETDVEAGGVLILTDSYDPNWVVTVDGTQAELLRAYTALRAVCLPSGKHQVVFDYQPRTFYAGVAISLIGWLGLAGIGVIVAVRQVRNKIGTS
jgi:hypothetical protein